jgi:hypothetical protein
MSGENRLLQSATAFESELRQSRGQELTVVNNKKSTLKHKDVKSQSTKRREKAIKDFNLKLDDLEKYVSEFNNQDLLFYFMYCYEKRIHKSFRPNYQRDLTVFKELLNYYSAEDICLMIEFLFNSPQDYISRFSMKPTIFKTGWCEKIFEDSNLWVDDQYYNLEDKKSGADKRNHNSSTWDISEETVTIGEW